MSSHLLSTPLHAGLVTAGRRPLSATSSPSRRRAGVVVRAERQSWDFGRFLETVLYFNKPPSPQDVLRKLFSGGSDAAAPAGSMGGEGVVQTVIAPVGTAAAAAGEQPVVLVTGATGGVGKRVVAQLLARGRRVRVLARDAGKARALLAGLPAPPGAGLELVAADLTQPATLLPAMFRGVAQVVSCSAVKVQPKEGDTADRSKYMQGIKFYDPEIAEDTPESVELGGMRHLLAAVGGNLGGGGGRVLFAPDGSGAVGAWGSLDDVVMGGVSQSGFGVQQGGGEDGGPVGVFSGNVTSVNNGGFASVRCRNMEPPLDLSGFEGLELRVKGNGMRYKLILRTEAGWDTVGYTQGFDTTADGWQTVRLKWADFLPVFRARTQRGMKPMNPARIYSIQLMLSKFEADGAVNPTFREGRFELPVQRISAYLPAGTPARFVHVSSAGVTRPNRPGIDVSKEPPAVQMNEQLGGILTYKLAAEDALRASGVPFAIVRPVALTEEPAGMPLVLEQGDTLKGKVSREDVAELCVALLEQPAAANTTFEVGSTVPFSQPWTGEGAAPRDWAAVLGSAGLQPRVTGKTIGGRWLGKEPEPEETAPAMAAV